MSETNDVFTVENEEGGVCFTFSSTLDNIDKVIIEAIDHLYSISAGIKEHAFAINLVLREGLTNAIRHGNQSDNSKTVRLWLGVHEDRLLKLVIEDQGDGFDWKGRQNAKLEEDAEHGRGIIIMDTYFTRYSYNDKGNILSLEKDL